MSKEAALRAMREARFAARAAASPAAPAKPRPPVAPPARAAQEQEPETDGLCGHRSMNGRTCTRERGHAAKNHRYS